LFDRCIAAHCVWLSDTEIALMRETGTQISHKPSSNAKLGNRVRTCARDARGGPERRDRARRRRVQQQSRPVRGDEVRVADPPRERVDPSLQQAPDVVPDGHAQRPAALRHETGELTAGKKADVITVDLLPTVVRDAGGARVRVQREAAAREDLVIIDAQQPHPQPR
jgi:5-methylthioadenosine/S-adenosylhomocysteine deaminase